MTMVHFRLADPSGIPLDGYVSLVPTRRVTVGDEIRLPTAVRVPLQNGEATVGMLPSTTQWVWRVAELVKGGITRYVAVPDTEGTAEYADLESVDPSSLDVSSASVPAWEIATRTAQEMLDRVGEIDGKVERAEDAAAGAESSAGAAESHENAARSSADAAASSARDAASSATAAASSAVEAAESVATAESHATSSAQSATAAAKSVAEAASSASAAASSAEQAANVVASVSGSVAQAENAARSASQSSTAAAGSASAAGGSAQAAADSASKAGESATAAGLSERNAASSAAQAAQSATAAAQSASEAQNAVNGFGLTVGSVTTGEPGTDASVDITKTGTKYTADFTIPRGDKGEQASVAHDDTLTGDGTTDTPLGVVAGTAIKPVDKEWNDIDFNEYYVNGIYTFNGALINGPKESWTSGAFMVLKSYQTIVQLCWGEPFTTLTRMAVRVAKVSDAEAIPTAESWSAWEGVASVSDIPDVSALTSRIAALEAKLNELAVMQTRLQALETRVNSLNIN